MEEAAGEGAVEREGEEDAACMAEGVMEEEEKYDGGRTAEGAEQSRKSKMSSGDGQSSIGRAGLIDSIGCLCVVTDWDWGCVWE